MADCSGEIGSSSNCVETILKIRWLIKTSLKKPNPNPNPDFAEARDEERKAYFLIRYPFIYCMFYLYFIAKPLTVHFGKLLAWEGDGVIPKVPWLTRTTLRPFRLFMLSSASAVVLPYPHSRWKVIHLLCLSLSFIYWAQKYTVTIHLNENHLVVIITLHRQKLHGAARLTNLNEKKRNLMR